MNQIFTGDNVAVMKAWPEKSIQLVVTSPPYDKLRSYNGFSWNFEAASKEIYRVLCDGGMCCWNVGDSVVDGSETLTSFRQAIYFKDVCGFSIHDTMIYEKSNFSHPEKRRYHQLFEYVFVLSKGYPRCFNPIKDKPNAWAGTGSFGTNRMRNSDGTHSERKRNIITEFGMRGNVWRCKTAGQERVCKANAHPAMMPYGLARDLILSFSNEGDIVLDPFAGSGTTCLAARENKRQWAAIEISPEYVEIFNQRLQLGMYDPMF